MIIYYFLNIVGFPSIVSSTVKFKTSYLIDGQDLSKSLRVFVTRFSTSSLITSKVRHTECHV